MRIRTAFGMALAGVLFGALTGVTRADAQTGNVAVGPPQTVPGYPGCGGNSKIQDVPPEGHTCANQRTYTFGAQSRTVTAVTTLNGDGTASSTYTLSAPVPFNVKLRVRSHVGISSAPGPLADDVAGEIPKGSAGPVTLSFVYTCGQIDVKAVFTDEGDERGRISGGFFCFSPPITTPTTTPTTVPTTVPGSSATGPTTVPGSSGPAVSVSVSSAQTLPATGTGDSPVTYIAAVVMLGGALLVVAARRRPELA